MIDNFDEVKKQLSELSSVINAFKSEAVQLRIVEIVLGGVLSSAPPYEEGPESGAEPKQSRRGKRKSARSKPQAEGEKRAPRKARSVGQGAVAILDGLSEGDFFAKPKTINDIVKYCEEKQARKFPSSSFSGKLARLTRDGVLDRTKNSDGQYEYVKR